MIRTVGVVGVGSMGRPMAENLMKAGFQVSVCDIRDGALAPFRDKGVAVSRTADALAGSDLIIVMVGNDRDVADVTAGPGGLAAALDPAHPAIVAIMSSVLPGTILAAAEALGPKGGAVIDAPVSGGPVRAAEAAISIMAAGSDEIFQRMEPVFDALGRPVFRCGPVGSAAGVKIVNNILGVANMLLMGEASHIATSVGIDLPFLLSVMEASSGRNFASAGFEGYRALHEANSADPDINRRLHDILRKDLRLATTLAGQQGVGAPITSAVADAIRDVPYEDLHARWKVALGRHGTRG